MFYFLWTFRNNFATILIDNIRVNYIGIGLFLVHKFVIIAVITIWSRRETLVLISFTV